MTALAPPVKVLRAPRAPAWFATPLGHVALLIAGTLAVRVIFASMLGLGNDESYMAAAGRTLRWGYFDHPPAGWWLAWAGAHLFGTSDPLAVRAPFIALFALSTWLMFRLTAAIFTPRAGFWASVMFNLSPVFGLTTASWVLPDGPLIASLLGAALCLVHALQSPCHRGWVWWCSAGLCAGLALFSKYTAVLTLVGAIAYLLAQPTGRAWLQRPQPYLGGLVALALFVPVIAWNARHFWVSLAFQAGRASSHAFHPFGPIASLAGEALFVLPWIWAGLVLCLWRTMRDAGKPTGFASKDSSAGEPVQPPILLCYLAIPPILLFTIVSLRSHVLFHWAAPGYLLLFPLLGQAVAQRWSTWRALRICTVATAALAIGGAAILAIEVRFDLLPDLGARFVRGGDPNLEAVDWTSLPADLAGRGLLPPGIIIGAVRWHDAGKLDYAFRGRIPVICLNPDAREYGLIDSPERHLGADVLLIGPRLANADMQHYYGPRFTSITPLPDIALRHARRRAMTLNLYLARRLKDPTP